MPLARLIELSETYLQKNDESLPRIHVLRRERISRLDAVIYEPVMCLILRGGKEVSIGDRTVSARAGDALLVSHDLPVISKITHASTSEPYLALILTLDLGMVRSLYEQVGHALGEAEDTPALIVGPGAGEWIDPLTRYLSLMNTPLDAQVLGPSLLREIHFRLLMSPIGGMLRNLLSVDSHASRIARAILRIRTGFRQPLAIADLARTAGMSVSSFHEHFRSVTGTTPLQYQKDLRLIEARSLLASGRQPVSLAAYAVGYESPTHFSRDYARKFGNPPSRDAMRSTEEAGA